MSKLSHFLLVYLYYMTMFFCFVFLKLVCMALLCSYELGGVYLQLCEVLRLDNHPIVKKPIDPSLYLHKYTSSKYPALVQFV